MTDVLEIDPNVILPKLRALRSGQSTVYFRGSLASARKQKSIALIADGALALAQAGKVCLTQRKIAEDCYDYIATGRATTVPPIASEGADQ